jgi:hypothetical protein
MRAAAPAASASFSTRSARALPVGRAGVMRIGRAPARPGRSPMSPRRSTRSSAACTSRLASSGLLSAMRQARSPAYAPRRPGVRRRGRAPVHSRSARGPGLHGLPRTRAGRVDTRCATGPPPCARQQRGPWRGARGRAKRRTHPAAVARAPALPRDPAARQHPPHRSCSRSSRSSLCCRYRVAAIRLKASASQPASSQVFHALRSE